MNISFRVMLNYEVSVCELYMAVCLHCLFTSGHHMAMEGCGCLPSLSVHFRASYGQGGMWLSAFTVCSLQGISGSGRDVGVCLHCLFTSGYHMAREGCSCLTSLSVHFRASYGHGGMWLCAFTVCSL